MSWTSFAELDGVSISGTEISIISGTSSLATDTNKGVYQLWLDPVGAGMAKGDEVEIKIYEKIEENGGTKRLLLRQTMGGAQTEPWLSPPFPLGFGWDMTIKKLAGTDRNWDAEIRKLGTWTQHAELDGVTVGASELSIISGTTSLSTDTNKGFYWVLVDQFNLAKTDYFEAALYDKVEATGGTKRRFFKDRLGNVPAEIYITPGFMLGNGWDATLIKIAGTDRAFDASIRKAA